MINKVRIRFAGTAVLTLLSTTLFSGTLLAGEKYGIAVVVDLPMSIAYGDMGTARNGSAFDTKSRIGCSINQENTVVCTAINSTGVSAVCSRFQAEQSWVNAVLNVSSEGYISFRWDESGKCTHIFVEKSSRWAPMR